jgi:hypothetical protein
MKIHDPEKRRTNPQATPDQNKFRFNPRKALLAAIVAGAATITPVNNVLSAQAQVKAVKAKPEAAAQVVKANESKVTEAQALITKAENQAKQDLEIRYKTNIDELESQLISMKQRLDQVYTNHPDIKVFLEETLVTNPKASFTTTDSTKSAAMATAIDYRQAIPKTQEIKDKANAAMNAAMTQSVNDQITQIQLQEGSSSTTRGQAQGIEGANMTLRGAQLDLERSQQKLKELQAESSSVTPQLEKNQNDNSLLAVGVAGLGGAGTLVGLTGLKSNKKSEEKPIDEE